MALGIYKGSKHVSGNCISLLLVLLNILFYAVIFFGQASTSWVSHGKG
ncbi:MAG: hypothetical protein SGJ04_05055 [Bacteroidota bacterium]|nr:hypothetical protein [Bacteroidota bacterium]